MKLMPLSDRSLNFLALGEANNNNANSCDLLILDGQYDMEVLATSVDQIARTHPVLQSRIVRKGLKYYWQYDALLYPPKLYLDWSDRYSDVEQWHKALRQYAIDNPIDPFAGSPLKFVYIRFKHLSAMLFLSSHAASDARSGYILFEQLHSILNKQTFPEEDNSFCEEHLIFDRVKLNAILKAGKYLVSELFKPSAKITIEDSSNWSVDYYDFGTAATESLVRWARQHQVSVNVALNYVLNKALNKGEKYTIIETISIRGIAKQDLASSYNNLIMPFGSEVGGDSCWVQAYQARLQNLKREGYKVHQAEQRIQSYSINLMPKFALKLLVNCYKHLFLRGNVILSNLGRLDFDLSYIGEHKIVDTYNFSVPLPPAGLALVVSTYKEKLRISFAHRSKNIEPIIKAIKHELSVLNE
ncbi:hypothetical protein [Pseudoalteromonas luteoviolacea]|uniref:Condensation domain-containing protein n=1 Tax=Pseudoalteromonas luteoviolacea H33 TaxID=1365251 RepID=A0A167ADG8_9GAMM|nr:hypothetical protein [Pseudoalteromonas luteoviolacea]KZN45260.1 hypothetical protein N476_04415 [Pseudoalteromonas luteoviolacea H33]KZN70876.1 hypothetical protein N477_05625 [Pseudoalteromonas luteoviolacea H33-S]MBQ4877206.1 hypothetical protein [Pseudoalteromonas luteoviolacea]MBQ4906067.1 hypothetical protein [Pseudoalteromonas luteoviolacea]